MSDKPSVSHRGQRVTREDEDRQQRLAEALRANLVRRKAQQRARAAGGGAASDPPDESAS